MKYKTKFFKEWATEEDVNEWLIEHPSIEDVSITTIGGTIILTYRDTNRFSTETDKKKHTVEAPAFIYDDIADIDWANKWKKIEEAIGFKLFYWQKTYIAGRDYRCSGKSTAEVLQNLLDPTKISKPIPLMYSPSWLQNMYKYYHEKLKSSDIPCRDLILD